MVKIIQLYEEFINEAQSAVPADLYPVFSDIIDKVEAYNYSGLFTVSFEYVPKYINLKFRYVPTLNEYSIEDIDRIILFLKMNNSEINKSYTNRDLRNINLLNIDYDKEIDISNLNIRYNSIYKYDQDKLNVDFIKENLFGSQVSDKRQLFYKKCIENKTDFFAVFQNSANITYKLVNTIFLSIGDVDAGNRISNYKKFIKNPMLEPYIDAVIKNDNNKYRYSYITVIYKKYDEGNIMYILAHELSHIIHSVKNIIEVVDSALYKKLNNIKDDKIYKITTNNSEFYSKNHDKFQYERDATLMSIITLFKNKKYNDLLNQFKYYKEYYSYLSSKKLVLILTNYGVKYEDILYFKNNYINNIDNYHKSLKDYFEEIYNIILKLKND